MNSSFSNFRSQLQCLIFRTFQSGGEAPTSPSSDLGSLLLSVLLCKVLSQVQSFFGPAPTSITHFKTVFYISQSKHYIPKAQFSTSCTCLKSNRAPGSSIQFQSPYHVSGAVRCKCSGIHAASHIWLSKARMTFPKFKLALARCPMMVNHMLLLPINPPSVHLKEREVGG